MLFQTMLRTGALAPMQREAVRILREIMERLDVTALPDGTQRLTFDVDVAFLDRLGVWGAHEADIEITGEDDEDDGTAEPDAHRLAKLMQADLPVRDVSEDGAPELSGAALAAIGDGLARLMLPQATPAPLRDLVGQIAA